MDFAATLRDYTGGFTVLKHRLSEATCFYLAVIHHEVRDKDKATGHRFTETDPGRTRLAPRVGWQRSKRIGCYAGGRRHNELRNSLYGFARRTAPQLSSPTLPWE
jgi:hypothetical protein